MQGISLFLIFLPGVQVALFCLLLVASLASSLPFNAAPIEGGWFYNGDRARAPLFAIQVCHGFLYTSHFFTHISLLIIPTALLIGTHMAWATQQGVHYGRKIDIRLM